MHWCFGESFLDSWLAASTLSTDCSSLGEPMTEPLATFLGSDVAWERVAPKLASKQKRKPLGKYVVALEFGLRIISSLDAGVLSESKVRIVSGSACSENCGILGNEFSG